MILPEITIPHDIEREISPDAYHLTDSRMDEIEQDIVESIKPKLEGLDHDGVVALVVTPESEFADFARTTETAQYGDYDNHKAMIPYEGRSLFVLTIDVNQGKVGHVKRLVFPLTEEEITETGVTGIEILDDRIQAGVEEEHATLEELVDQTEGFTSPANVFNVTSNHMTKRTDRSSGTYTYHSYKAVYQVAKAVDVEGLFAYLNSSAVRSLGEIGLEYALPAGRELHIPEPGSTEEYDEDYTAVFIPNSETNNGLFIDGLLKDLKVPVLAE